MSNQEEVSNYWEKEVCGSRNSKEKKQTKNYYYEIAEKRYLNEPYIIQFAFEDKDLNLLNKKILEIGVGAGSDFVGFLKRGGICYGIDATDAAIKETSRNIKERLIKNEFNLQYLKKGNAEHLPFETHKFDLVYSHGVLHHAKNTMKCIAEAIRVLKPGGTLKLMVYSTFSATGIMLWFLYGLGRGKLFISQEEILYNFLESPGTKSYSKKEFKKILNGFGLENIQINKYSLSGDLLLMPPSMKYKKNFLFKVVRKIYPRFIVKKMQNIFGLAITVTAKKPF